MNYNFNRSIERNDAVADAMTEAKDENTRPDADLRDHLHQMEAKVRKLRDARNNHNDQAKRFAEQRNGIQAQYKEHREKLDMSVAEVKAIRAEQNLHKTRRDAIQAQIRDLIGQAKPSAATKMTRNPPRLNSTSCQVKLTTWKRPTKLEVVCLLRRKRRQWTRSRICDDA